MRIFFDPGCGGPPQSHQQRAFGRFLDSISGGAGPHVVVRERSLADVVIFPSDCQLDSRPADVLWPLAAQDLQRLTWDWGDRPTGRMSGFYCALPRRLFDPRRHRTMSYPLEFNELVEEYPLSDAKCGYGFMGGISTPFRRKMIDTLKRQPDRGTRVLTVQENNWAEVYNGRLSQQKYDYVDFLRTTKFILCPRGYGVGSVRLFETMKAGRVPIIISDRYVLPADIDWNRCSIRVRESDVDKIPELVEARLAEWEGLARVARKVWLEHFSPDTVVRYLGRHIEQLLGDVPDANWASKIVYSASVGREFLDEKLRPFLGAVRQRIKAVVGIA